ncbi:Ergosterol biosynthetic protein 28 [Fusarium oxysporum f. sp. albedinis]|nr:Ergosterol biosynthetic protein 28 [Fusarium oxysporum f. sp. albedinis]
MPRYTRFRTRIAKTSPEMYDNVEPRVHQLDDLAVSYSIDDLSRLHSTILRCTPPPKSCKRAVTIRT